MNDGHLGPGGRLGRLARDAAIGMLLTIGLLAGAEVVLRVAAPQNSHLEYLSGSPRAVEDGVLGHRYRPNARARYRTPEFEVDYVINDRGRRDSAPFGHDSLALRVLVLGDSFTFGAGNPEGDVWTAVMKRALAARGHRVDVVNAGVEAYDTRSEALYLEELEPEIQPDVVVLGFAANDLYTNMPPGSPAPVSAVVHRGRPFALHTVEWAKRMLLQNDRLYAWLFLMTSRKEYYAIPPGERFLRQVEITGEWLTRMQTFCNARRIRFAVVSIPQQFSVVADVRPKDFPGIDPSMIDRYLSTLARERGFPWIETLPALIEAHRSGKPDTFYPLDGHLTREGNRVVGETAADRLGPYLIRRDSRPHLASDSAR